MHAKIIFWVAVTLAILTVILLVVLSPIPHTKSPPTSKPSLALSLYIQQPPASATSTYPAAMPADGAVIFHRSLTEGPENTSPVIGKAQGFIIPVEHFADIAFNIIYLTFETPQYSGSLSVQAKKSGDYDEEFKVVGGTGAFAFARGVAVFVKADKKPASPSDVNVGAAYHVKLQLSFGNHSRIIPG